MENKCSTQDGSCETHESSCGPSQEKNCCPIEKATQLWTCAFFEAMKQAHVEVLKAKILKAWGPKLDKSADAVLETMETQWQSMLAQGKSKMDLKERLAKIMTEGKK